MMTLNAFLATLKNNPDSIEFADTLSLIDSLYEFQETEFRNGNLLNRAGENNGSCKIFAFAQLHKLSQQQTLSCFGAFYRDDVLKNPEGTGHQNIRNFMESSWQAISFSKMPLNLEKSVEPTASVQHTESSTPFRTF